ncbi:MASE4 domain-containing protein [Bradyrhizobium sp. CB2312]|uniref:MASE4 domain-containing protein n=1 Tax=Bradyrhizobium sp. CB2312 TaxID=3039155 RepID=UPI0024B1F4CF|nr:MASE4 domain-containing protein [Bradyrhizobium sp. CB2312]WFU73422.1 MASE4 domain-containing protein [Bradyrhizobium sp. CB2312]
MSISASYPVRDGDGAFLSKAAPGPRELRLCLTLIGISLLVFLACVPFVRVQLSTSPAFVAVYNALSTFNDFTTSIILFGQFSILRSRALLLVAGGYLFASLMSVIQLLAFPGVFAAAGLPGAGPQTALWLCIFWHGGFPLAVIAYVLSDGHELDLLPHAAIGTVVAVVMGAVLICWFAATWGAENGRLLPPLLDASGFTSWQRVINLIDIILAASAFSLLWKRRQHRLLDLWLMVVMSYWLCDIILSSYLNTTRYDLGFYAGRIYGVLAASFVLAVLVLENSRLYRQLAAAASRLREHAAELLQANEILQREIAYRKHAEDELRRAQAELARVSRMTAMGELTSSLAHEVNHPIGAMMLNAETCLRWLSQEIPNVERARTIANMILKDCARASETVARIQQLFHKRAMLREPVDVNDLIREMIALLHTEAVRFSVSIRTELTENLSQVSADRAQLKQVLMNLMINGMEAMSDGESPRELFITSELVEERQIAVSVRDTGVGLPPLPSNQIFNSFITTKPHSVGIGLSISRSIIEEHGGRLRAANNSSRGAQFQLTLPIGVD